MVLRLLVLLALLGLALGRPIVIGHRGAPGYRPEHTFDSYGLAIDLGADFIELDLQPTKDNELIVLHDHDLSVATDVALHPEFADRFSWRVKYGKNESGWWPEDFLLSEIRTLRVRQVIAFRNQDFNWLYSIPTFNETIQFLMAKQSISKRTVGLLVELKDPAYFAALGLAIEPNVLNSLRAYNYSLSKPDPTRIIIQSFEVASMQWVHSQCNVTLVQLINVPTDFIGPTNETFAQLLQQLPLIKTYAWGIGPWKSEIVPQVNSSGGSGGTSLLADTTLIKEAHALGLKVFAWTFRSDSFYLNAQYHGSWEEEYFRFARAGLDGFITDFTDNAITALDAYAEQEQDSTAIAQEFAVTVGLLVAALLGLAICAVVLFKRPVSPPAADTEHLTREPSLPKYT